MEPKTFIILTPGFPKDEADTTCLPTQQLFVRTLSKLFPFLIIKVITLHYPDHASVYKWHGIDIYPLSGKSKKGIIRIALWYRCYQLIKKICGTNTLGILSFWCNETALIGKFFASRNHVTHKIWITGQDARASNKFVRWIKPHPDELVTMSDFLKAEFFKNHRINPSHVITNGTDLAAPSVKKDIDIIGAGSLIPLKQYNIFIEIVAVLAKNNPTISAVLFGHGPEEDSLKQRISRLGLEKNIQLKGEADHPTLMAWMNRSKVLLHPSSYEGYSTVCLEALANGCHVVSFTHAENDPIVHWHTVNEKEQMISVTERILQTESDYTPINIHPIEVTVKQMMTLFEKH
ncbi:MAG TPA: glycosyltransferase [Chryseosolibacter sp.]